MIGDIYLSVKTIAEPFSWALIYSLWQGFIIACILIIALSLFRNANSRLRYSLACGAMAIMFLTTIFTFIYMLDNNSYSSIIPSHAANVGSPAIESDQFIDTQVNTPSVISGNVSIGNPGDSLFMGWIFSFWLLGVIIVSAYNLLGWHKARYLVSTDTVPVDNYWQARFNLICDKLKLKREMRLIKSAMNHWGQGCVISSPTMIMVVSCRLSDCLNLKIPEFNDKVKMNINQIFIKEKSWKSIYEY